MESVDVAAEEFKQAMRELAGAISIITVSNGVEKTGFVATSVSSFSADPPRVIFCISRTSSSWDILRNTEHFGINFMRESEKAIASRFIGTGGIKGADRYAGADWITLPSGTQVLKNALASIDCTIEEVLERHDHAIIIGKVKHIRICDCGLPLLWFKSQYHAIGNLLTDGQ